MRSDSDVERLSGDCSIERIKVDSHNSSSKQSYMKLEAKGKGYPMMSMRGRGTALQALTTHDILHNLPADEDKNSEVYSPNLSQNSSGLSAQDKNLLRKMKLSKRDKRQSLKMRDT